MLNKILYLLLSFVIILCFTQTFLLGGYFLGKKEECSQIIKNICIDIFPSIYQNGMNSTIYFTGKYEKSNKIDIIISNHISTVDYLIYLSLIKQYDNRDIYFLAKKELVFTPGIGTIFYFNNDIKLSRNIDNDKDNIINTIQKIKNTNRSSVILILPEGTRYSEKKYKESVEYSQKNNLHKFKNLLYPKMKGLWLIYKSLVDMDSMGNIIDISVLIENIRNKNGYLKNILTKKLGNTMSVFSSYTPPTNLDNYGDFKNWFIDVWKIKDNTLNNMLTVNDIHIYKKIDSSIKYSNYILLVLVITMTLYFIYATNFIYVPISFLLSGIIMGISYFTIGKSKQL
jgi:1-acyl-sn-glycerol-3-phosphate acyltransferase